MKALSVREPYASAIITGPKRIENRSRPTRHRGPLLIHAARQMADITEDEWQKLSGLSWPADPPRGVILGVVEVVDSLPMDELGSRWPDLLTPWATGPWCWVLANARGFARVVPWSDQVGLFDVPDEVVQSLL